MVRIKIDKAEPELPKVPPAPNITIVLETWEEIETMFHALNFCGRQHYLATNPNSYPNSMTFNEYDAARQKLWNVYYNIYCPELQNKIRLIRGGYSRPYEPLVEEEISHLDFIDFDNNQVTLYVLHGSAGHDHLYLVKKGKVLGYFHIVFNYRGIDFADFHPPLEEELEKLKAFIDC